jgi:hypothetical protein
MEETMTDRISRPAPKRRASQRSTSPVIAAEAAAMPADTTVETPPAEDAVPVEVFALVTGQGQQGAGFSFKVLATGALFRCQIMRNPNQPRFWCITIFLCLDGGSPDTEQPRWLSNDRFNREEMPGALEAVRSNLAGWLAEPSRAELRKWVLTQASRSPMASNPRFARAAAAT